MIASRFSDRNSGGDLLCQYADTGLAESRRFVTGLLSPGKRVALSVVEGKDRKE
jgi:hypothetical protein